jgi:integrase
MKMDLIKEWINSYLKRNTKIVYFSSIKNFLISIYGGNLENENEYFEELASKYLEEVKKGRDYFKDILNFINFLNNKPPITISSYINGIKSFLNFHLNIELTKKQSRIIRSRIRGNRIRTIEGDLTKEKLKKILEHTDLKGRALFLFLVSSGIRIGEALKLRINDIDLNYDPPIVYVRGEYTKSGNSYFSFITKEAKESLIEWLKIRGEYNKIAFNRGRGLEKAGFGRGKRKEEDNRIFPFSIQTAEIMWYNALKKANFEKKDEFTKRRDLHIHMLRKFFMSQAKLVIPHSIVEALAGHNEYLDEAYRRYTKEQLADFYKKAEPNLYIFIPKEIREIQTHYISELEDTKKKVENLTLQLTNLNTTTITLMKENSELKNQLSLITSSLEEIYDQLNMLHKKIKKKK